MRGIPVKPPCPRYRQPKMEYRGLSDNYYQRYNPDASSGWAPWLFLLVIMGFIITIIVYAVTAA